MKFYNYALLTILFLGLQFAQAQNLMVNGDLESWTGGEPDGWDVIENISQETTTVHTGSSSAAHTSDQTTKDFRQEIEGIQGGQEYNISYWYYDNDPMARTRPWCFWTSAGATLPDHAEILRPSTYSEDNGSWLEFNETLIAPASADGFRFEIRVYKQDALMGGAVYYDDFSFSGDIVVNPEPSNYPTSFNANAVGSGIELGWTDATGPDLPVGYIIMAGINASLPVPNDGTPVADDLDLSDGSGALNVVYGQESAFFAGLEANTTYYFSIYPYSNAGANIDYKNDGTAPTANETTANLVVIEFENFDESWGNWTTISVIGDEVWDRDNTYGLNGTPCAKMSGYNGQPYNNEDWLISPELDLSEFDGIGLNFYTAMAYTGPDLECLVSTDYSGGGDPNSATWDSFSFTFSTEFFEWTESGNIDLSPYSGSIAYVAFKFTSTTDGSATWEVDDISITGEGEITVDPEPSNYPTSFSAIEAGSAIDLSWTDATGAQLPDSYIIYAGINSSLPVPVDGTPVVNDLDLSDGSGAVNMNFGVEAFTFSNLDPATTYYFTIYPYTNSGVNIDYKTDGTAPTSEATTGNTVPVVIESENFDDSWGSWTTISVTGTNVWERDNTWGIGSTPCASATGYMGGSPPEYAENEDWLISPAMNFDDYENEKIVFFNAMEYTGPDMEFKVSTDYSGSGDPNSANWNSIPFSMSTGGFEWTNSGELDLSEYNGNAVYVAFVFTSTDNESATWEVDDITISGEEEFVIEPEPSSYPTAFNATAGGSSVNLEWADATGSQLPDAYIIYAGINASLPVPADGTPVANDTDLSDGSGAVNVNYGTENFTFSNLDPSTTYYFSIYPYTNSGINIDYKNDGSAPTSEATTGNTVEVTIEEENFDDSWGSWTTLSVIGTNGWERDNTWGIGSTPCASATGYMGGSPPTYAENEDWLISPAMNFDDYENEKIVFFNAKNYSGPDMEFKVSTDYTGSGDPNSANWNTIAFTKSPGDFTWTNSGELNLSSFNGNAVYVAFVFYCTDATSATWEVDDITISGEEEAIIVPEPTNYPTNFVATAVATNIGLSWTDATGDQLPDAYIIFASTDNASLPTPEDGIPVEDDTNLSDGSGAINVNFGTQQAAFNNLNASTPYYFSIYPYTNSSVNIDYKNDGSAPTANATTGFSPIIEFENFDDSWGNWTRISVVGDQVWGRDNNYGLNGTPCAQMSGHEGDLDFENDDWLISPQMDLSSYDNVILSFHNAKGWNGDDMQLKISTDYSGGNDPYAATWTNLAYNLSPGYYEWTFSGEIDLSDYLSNGVYIAFQYTCSNVESATWEVDDILIESAVLFPEPTNYPTNFSADESGSSILLSWTDAIGAQLPDAYIVFASTNNSLPVPSDGIPISNDPDLSNGSGAMNVAYGIGEFSFSGFSPATTYYFSIYPYTNTGSDIDYKNDGTAPTDNATTQNVVLVTIEEEGFNSDWGNWERVSVTGSNEWDRGNSFGIGNTPCASMTGYMGGSPPTYEENDDWLISPALNFNNYGNEKIVFYNAKSYNGPDMTFKISTDYSGNGDPYSASWTELSYTMSGGDFTWTNSGEIDLSSFNGNAVHVAFIFTCTNSGSATWEVDDILITGEEEYVLKPEPTNYPANFTATGLGVKVNTYWDDATGTQIPEGYVVYASTSSQLPVPMDGVVVQNDSYLGDGQAVMNVAYGEEFYLFENGLIENQEYFFTIYPYTNSGNDIDYKNGGTAPVASAITAGIVEVVIEEENFNDGWGLWTRILVVGTQEWQRDNTFGPDNTPCATISGYVNPDYEQNENWLVSPQIDLSDYVSAIFTFQTATGYWGNPLQALVSTDYDGLGNPNSATWTTLDATMANNDEFWIWFESGDIDLTTYSGGNIYLAFKYTSTPAEAATWELDNIVVKGLTLGVDDNFASQNYVSVFPNPSNSLLNIQMDQQLYQYADIKSITGNTVMRFDISGLRQQIDLSVLEDGVYFILFINERTKNQEIHKLIIQ